MAGVRFIIRQPLWKFWLRLKKCFLLHILSCFTLKAFCICECWKESETSCNTAIILALQTRNSFETSDAISAGCSLNSPIIATFASERVKFPWKFIRLESNAKLDCIIKFLSMQISCGVRRSIVIRIVKFDPEAQLGEHLIRPEA